VIIPPVCNTKLRFVGFPLNYPHLYFEVEHLFDDFLCVIYLERNRRVVKFFSDNLISLAALKNWLQ